MPDGHVDLLSHHEHLFFFLISGQNGNNFIVICFSFGAVSEFNMAIRHNNVI
jgi:hypothetical protein